jgi:hypothetical protein
MVVESIRSRFSLLLTAALVALTLAGCANGRKPVTPVRGKVFFNRRPAEGALVVLHPVESDQPDMVRPQGTVGSDGAFELTTYDVKDGAPAGEYNVTFVWLIENPKTKTEWSPLPARYMAPDKSGVRVTVREGTSDLPPIELVR